MKNYTFGNYICDLREKKGLTQSQLGEKLGVSNKAISKWENGGSYPSTDIMLPLAKELGVSIEALYSALSNNKAPKSKPRQLLDMMVEKSNWIILSFTFYTFLLWGIFLFCGNSPDKVMILILTPIVTIMIYGFILFGFSIMKKSPLCPPKYLDFVSLFFVFFAFMGEIITLSNFILAFPNGFGPSVGMGLGLIGAILHSNRKRI